MRWAIVLLIASTGCDGAGASETCGDGMVQAAEVCDDGANNSDSDPNACQPDCTRCGCDPRSTCTYDGDTFACGPCPDDWVSVPIWDDSYENICYTQLLALEVVGGSLDATFDPAVLAYTVTVDASVTEIAFIPTVTPGAGVEVNGIATTSGQSTPAFGLEFGTNVFDFDVTDGQHTTVLVQLGMDITVLQASNPDPEDSFGSGVSIDGDTLVVAAIGEASAASGVGGDQTDNSAAHRGAAYVFREVAGTWTQEAYLKPTISTQLYFGRHVDVSGDRLAVSSDNHVDLFQRSGAVWTADTNLPACIAGALDGDTLVTACGDEARIYRRDAVAWTPEATLDLGRYRLLTSQRFALDGDLVALTADREVEGTFGRERVTVVLIFHRTGTTWLLDGVLEIERHSALGLDGARLSILVGAWEQGHAAVYVRSDDGWTEELTTNVPATAGDVALALPYLATGGFLGDRGVWLRALRTSGWHFAAYLDVPQASRFGAPLALSPTRLAVGNQHEASASGAVYVIALP